MVAVAKKPNSGKVHRLEDLEVREVSIVDKPANGRRFSAIKNEDGMANELTEIDTDDNGELTAPSDKPSSAPKTNDIAKMFGTLETAFNDERITKSLSMPEDMKREAYKTLRAAIERIHAGMGAVQVSQSTPEGSDGSPFSKMIGDEMNEIAKLLRKLGRTFSRNVSKSEDDDSDLTFADALSAVTKSLDEAKEGIEKRGAKMASRRLEVFEKAVNDLAALLQEIRGSAEREETEKALTAKDEEIASLRATLTKSEETNKKLRADNRRLRDARPASASIPVEKGETGESDDAQVWPLDMNKGPSKAPRF